MPGNSQIDGTTICGRADERVKLRRRAQLVLESGELPLDVMLEDVSFGGAGMMAEVDLQIGSRAVLLLQCMEHAPRSIRGHVRDFRRVDGNQFRISMQFDVVTGPTLERIRYAFFQDDGISE